MKPIGNGCRLAHRLPYLRRFHGHWSTSAPKWYSINNTQWILCSSICWYHNFPSLCRWKFLLLVELKTEMITEEYINRTNFLSALPQILNFSFLLITSMSSATRWEVVQNTPLLTLFFITPLPSSSKSKAFSKTNCESWVFLPLWMSPTRLRSDWLWKSPKTPPF